MKKKLLKIILLIVIISVVIFLCLTLQKNSEKVSQYAENTNHYEKSDSNNVVIGDSERKMIEEYINIICNRNLCNRLPEFNDINKADKLWIYAHINRDQYEYYATEKEIKDNLQDLFGTNLMIDVYKDTNSIDDITMPKYDTLQDAYSLPVFGIDININYVIDTMNKINDTYVVNVIEYIVTMDIEKEPENNYAIYTYDENEETSMKKIFEREKVENADEEVLVEELTSKKVLEQKEKFSSYNITIIKNENGKFNVTKVEKIK